MNVQFCDKRGYENKSAFGVQKNKAKSKPISNVVQWCEESHPTGLEAATRRNDVRGGSADGETRAGCPCHDVRATVMLVGQVVSEGFF